MTLPALAAGVRAADELLHALGYQVLAKADDPLTRKGFDAIVARIALELLGAVEDLDTAFAQKVLELLDLDFAELSAAEREAVLQAVELALPRPARYAGRVIPIFAREAEPLVALARLRAVKDVTLPLLDLVNDAVVTHLEDGQAYFVAAGMQVRNAELNHEIRALIGRALAEGWRRKDLVRALEGILAPEVIAARQAGYLDVVAAAFTGYARTYGQLTAYRDAGIERYVFEAVLDEVTSDICRFMHGRVFTVQGALSVFDRMGGFADNTKDAAPWVRVGRNDTGERVLYTKSMGHRREFATVVRSGVGAKDDQGEFQTVHTSASLEALGVCLPPLHGRCRSTVVADV